MSTEDISSLKEQVKYSSALPVDDISRYSRQLILDEVSVAGQLKLKGSSVLIVGAGGLGCPSSLYLAAAGVGTLGIVDHDTVALDNLHRQIAHTEAGVGTYKVQSASDAVKRLNSTVKTILFQEALNADNAENIVKQFDVVLDCTDNVATRYLLNDACVITNRPLVSGSALRFDGQVTSYHCNGGPCYRCLFPEPPPAHTVTNCSDGGVLGVIPGIIGSLQALEAMHIILGKAALAQKMILFDGKAMSFRNVKLRPRSDSCAVCGSHPTITKASDVDYPMFCGSAPTDKTSNEPITLLKPEQSIKCIEYCKVVARGTKHALLDVRPATQFNMCSLQNSKNIPYEELQQRVEEVKQMSNNGTLPVYCLCRRGNNSQRAIALLQERFPEVKFVNIWGGITAWHNEIDETLPLY